MYIVDSGAFLRMIGERFFFLSLSLSPGERMPLGDPNREWHRPFHERRRGLTSRSSALTFASSCFNIRLRYYLLDGCAMSWGISALGKQEETPK